MFLLLYHVVFFDIIPDSSGIDLSLIILIQNWEFSRALLKLLFDEITTR